MPRIEIDDELFAFLQSHAEPLRDTPNSVLRRLLLHRIRAGKNKEQSDTELYADATGGPDNPDEFVEQILQERFGKPFEVQRPYRLMFTSSETLVYIQNYNDPTAEVWWYRLHAHAIEQLRSSKRDAFVCFTNPALAVAYVIPAHEIIERLDRQPSRPAERPDVDVHIDHTRHLWNELEWLIDAFLWQGE